MTEAGLGAGDSLNPKVWRGVKLKEFAIYHGEPPCAAGETMFPAYHHGDYPGQTENLELRSNGSLVVSWDDRSVELQTKIREDITITEKAPSLRAFSCLKVVEGAFNQEKDLVGAFSITQ